MGLRCLAGPDFREGIRAQVVDKDRNSAVAAGDAAGGTRGRRRAVLRAAGRPGTGLWERSRTMPEKQSSLMQQKRRRVVASWDWATWAAPWRSTWSRPGYDGRSVSTWCPRRWTPRGRTASPSPAPPRKPSPAPTSCSRCSRAASTCWTPTGARRGAGTAGRCGAGHHVPGLLHHQRGRGTGSRPAGPRRRAPLRGRPGFRRRGGGRGRHADLHGRRAAGGLRDGAAPVRRHGQARGAMRRARRRPGREGLQQPHPGRLDDRGQRGVRARARSWG